MPSWMQIVLGAAGLATAFGVIWSKVVLPAAKLITDAQEMLPLLKDLPILREIIAEFRTDSGSSLKDQMNRIEESADKAMAVSERLAIDAEVIRRLAETDRETLRRVERLGIRSELGSENVAKDLAGAQQRAEDVHDDEAPGTAADVAALPPPPVDEGS